MEKDKKSKKGTRQQAKREEKPPSKAKNQKKKVERSDDESSDNEDVQTVIPTQKKKPASLFAFAMLADDAGDDDKSSESEDSEPEPTVQKKPIIQVNQKNAKKQQPTKTGKKNQKEEEDFDAVLAEFSEKPAKQTAAAEKKGKKMKKGAKDVDEIFENLKLQEDIQNGTSEQPAHPQEQKKSPEIRADMTADELAQIYEQMNMENEEDDDDVKRKKKKGNKQQQQQKKSEKETLKSGDEESDDDDDEDGSTVKSAAQKKKEKKERQKAEKLLKAQQAKTKPPTEKTKKEGTANQEPPKKSDVQSAAKPEVEVDEDNQASKKDKKKKKGDAKEEEKTKKSNKMVSKILEVQRLLKEEEERKRREEEEKMRKEEEEQRLREEKERLEREKKERKKQKEKERIKRLKAEGKFLTEKQKEDRKRAQQMLESYKAQGVEIPLPTDKIEAPVVPEEVPQEKLKRVVYTKKAKVKAQQQTSSGTPSVTTPTETEQQLLMPEADKEEKPESEEDVKDNWDDSSDSDDDSQASGAQETTDDVHQKCQKNQAPNASDSSREEDDEEEEEDDEDDDDDDSSSEDEDDGKTPQERLKEKALAAIEKRKAAAEAAKSADKLRAPVICVLGHVDTGKTKILDKLRRSHVQDGEAGGITQQIGATNVPHGSLKEQIKMCKEIDLKIPGLLIIDTPGHESFSNLRTRGSSLCDIAILVVDIMHGLEPQTIESINILKQKKTPFIVALNKIDRLFGWVTNCHADIVNQLKKQKPNTKMEFDERAKHVIVQFAEQGLNARLFYENTKPREFISLVPTSATTGDGVGNLMALICELTQTMMLKRIMLSEELQATVMEVKAIAGHGTTIDVILVNGKLAVGNTIVVAGQEGPIVTQIRSLLLPPPMHEIRVKSNFESHKEVLAAQGCKIAAKDLEKAIAGLPLYVAHNPEEVEIYREELSQMLKDVLSDIKVSEKGVYVQASTLGSLESLLSFLKSSKIPFSGINIGPVHKRDVVKTMAMLEHDPLFACILAFDVKVEKDAQEMAESNNIQIFQADIIYHLFDNFTAFRKRYYQQKQEEFKHIAMFPCKVRIMPEHVFNSRDPIICGVVVEAGFVKEGTILCVPSKNFIDIGRVSSLEVNHKQVEKATKGMEVCLKIDPIPGDAPKMVGRHFEVTDELVSKISRNSIDAVKNWFRDDMDRADWQLIVELKKIFGII